MSDSTVEVELVSRSDDTTLRELNALATICDLIERFDAKTRVRMLNYIIDRTHTHPLCPLPKQQTQEAKDAE